MALPGTLIEEPQTGTFVPLFLDTECSWRLLGTALRKKRVVVDVQVYVLSVYGGPVLVDGLLKAREAFLEDSGRTDLESFDTLGFLLSSREDKVFCMTFLRTVSGQQVVAGLTDSLCNLAGVAREDVKILTPLFPPSVPCAAQVRITSKRSSGVVLVKCSWNEEEECLVSPELSRGLEECFLGLKALVQGLAESSRHLLMAAEGPHASETPQSDLLSNAGETPTFSQEMTVDSEKRSWKEKSGRVDGKDGYEFGDVYRSLVKTRKSHRPTDQPWRGPLVLEEGATWVATADIPPLSDDLSDRVLESKFLKHHTSAIRGFLAPEWSERIYRLQGGLISYRRRSGGRLIDRFSLDGCHVVAEPPRISCVSQSGEFLVFRVLRGSELLCRLASCDRKLMVEWVSAIAAAALYFHDGSTPATQSSSPAKSSPASPQLGSSEAPCSLLSAAVANVTPTPTLPPSLTKQPGWNVTTSQRQTLRAVLGDIHLKSLRWLQCSGQKRCGKLFLLLVALFTMLIAKRTLSRRRLVAV